MKPYLVHKTWVDLDHVVAIDSILLGAMKLIPYIGLNLSYGGGRLEILIPIDNDRAKKCLDDFIAAWKAKDDPLPRCVPQTGLMQNERHLP